MERACKGIFAEIFSRYTSIDSSQKVPWYQTWKKKGITHIVGALQIATHPVYTIWNQLLPTLSMFLKRYDTHGMRVVNTSSGGSLGDMAPTKIREMIQKLAIESNHYGHEWYTDKPRGVNEINSPHLKSQIYEMLKVALLLMKGKGIVSTKSSVEST